MMDGLKNMSQVLDYALFFFYYYYVTQLLWFIYRHYMKHCSFLCEHCVSRTKNCFNGFILINLYHLQWLVMLVFVYVDNLRTRFSTVQVI